MSSSTSIIQCSRRMPHLCTFSIMKCYFNKIFYLSITHRRNHLWGIRWIFIVLSCLFLMINAHRQQVKQCMSFPSTAGWTVPEGDIFVKHGDNLQIWCNLNETFVAKEYPGSNSWNIYFTSNNYRIEEKFITRINKTTALLTIESPPAGYFLYFCSLDLPNGVDATVCLNIVSVAYEPQLPSNFICRSYNWERITCTWDVSRHYIPTTYKLFYQIRRAGRRKLVPCPIAKAKNYSCTWTQHTNPIYRQTKKIYKFVMRIQNIFGNKTVVYNNIDHFAIVIPPKPANLSMINKTSDSATLCWESRHSMWSFPPGLTHRVMYTSYLDYEKEWKIINIDTEPNLHKRCSTLTGLYANTPYGAYVNLRSAKAVGEDMYSVPAFIMFRTPPTLPSFPPRTDIGSFEIVEHNGTRDVYLYWQMIEQYHENGDKLKYQVIHVEENGHKIVLEPNEIITKTYAKFERLSFNKYRFEIVSENEVGISKNYTEIIVPNRNEMPREPIEFTKMAFGRGLYELSWVPPITHKDITNYTIFWCDNDRLYQCTGYLNWTHVSMNTTVYNITVPDSNKIYQFAISANANEGSSGMIWSSCTVIRSKKLERMKVIWINRVGLDFIEVGWYLACLDRIGVIEEVKIYYCPLVSRLVTKCKEPKRNISINYHPYRTYGIVKNLTARTTYMLELTMVTKYGESQRSKSLYQTIYETAPSTLS